MREEIQKMNDALRQTVQLQAQMAAHQRQAANSYGSSKAGFALDVRDRVLVRGANVYDISSGSLVPPSNINPTGRPLGSHLPGGIAVHRSYLGAQSQLLHGGAAISSGLAAQSSYQNDLNAKKEREESIKLLSNSPNAAARILFDISKKIEKERADASRALDKATQDYKEAAESGAKDIGKLTKAVNEAASNFSKINEQAEEFEKNLNNINKTGGFGGNGGGPPGLFDGLSRGQKAALAGAAAIGAVGYGISSLGVYSNMRGAALGQDVSNALAISTARSEIGAMQQRNYFAMAAPRTGEEMLRAYGNLLAPTGTSYQYLGFQNRARLQEDARRLTEASRSAELLQTGGSLAEGVGGVVRGAGGLLAGRVLASGAGQALLTRLASRFATGTAASAFLGPAAPFVGMGLAAYSAYDLAKSGYNLFEQFQGAAGTRVGQEFGGRIFGNERMAVQNQRYQRTLETLRNEEALRQGELGTFASRQMAMGLDEYIMSLRNRVSMTSMVGGRAALGFEAVVPMLNKNNEIIARENKFKELFPESNNPLLATIAKRPSTAAMIQAEKVANQYAELGYTFTEAGALKNNLLAVQQNVSSAQLFRAMQLTRAGVGTGEQLAGNILGISAVSGKAGDLSQLEKVFTRAFTAGLKGSPEIQKFVQSSTEISSILKLQTATGAADILSSVTAAMRGASGSSLMFMAEAQKGISGFAATTGMTSGIMGTLKAITGAGAGLTAASGLGLFAGANAYQIQDAIKQIESGTPVEKMTGLARQMVGAQRYGGATSDVARSNVLSVLKRGKEAIQMPFAAGYEMVTGESFASVQGKAANLFNKIGKGGKESSRAREELKDLMYSYGSAMVGMGGADNIETAQAQFLASLPPGMIESGNGKKALESEIARGQQAARSDYISVNYKKMLNKAAMSAVSKAEGFASQPELQDVAQSLGINVNDTNWYEQLQSKAMSSGVDIRSKAQGQVSFRDLANVISAAGGEEMSKKSMIIEDISANALQRLQRALDIKVMTPEKFDGIPGAK